MPLGHIQSGVANDGPETAMDSALVELFHQSEQVPFVYWRRFSGAKTVVLLVSAVAVIAFVTGLSHLSQGTGVFNGPLASYFPAESASTVLLSGVLLGFALGAVAIGLRRRKRLALYGAVLGLSLSSLLALVTAEPTDVLLFLLPLVTLPLVVRNRAAFDQQINLSPFQTVAIVAFVAGQVYGTVGAYALRPEYNGIGTWTDALYYVVVTGTTVGYGDATPITQEAKLFTLSVIVVGAGTFAIASGSLIIPALESRLTAAFGTMTASQLSLLENHIVVLGYGDLTEPLLDELVIRTDVVVVTPDPETASVLDDRDINVLTADPTDERALLDARIEVASGVVAATNDDAQDVLAVLAAREANPDVRVVAAATNHHHVDKLRSIGADDVISPSVIVGRRLGRSVLGDAGTWPNETVEREDDGTMVNKDSANHTIDET